MKWSFVFIDRIMVFLIFIFTGAAGVCSAQPTGSTYIQRLEIPSSFNPVGSGARALGMGGAFIAVADDATSASWNPGGLIQLETPEISMVGSIVHRIEDNTMDIYPEAGGVQTIDLASLNYFSAAWPFTVSSYNMIVSINYQHLYDMTRQWNFPLNSGGSNDYLHQNVDYRQKGGMSAIGLAYCIQITPYISTGLTLNIWNDGLTPNGWEQNIWQWGKGYDYGDEYGFESYLYDEYVIKGGNTNLGVMWNVNGALTLGAVLKTPFDADVDHNHERNVSIRYANPNIPDQADDSAYSEDGTLSMPMSFGFGAAWRFSDNLTVSFDLYRTQWDDFEYEDGNGVTTSPINNKPAAESGIDPAHQIRIGAEYLYIAPKFVIPARCGLFYDPAPAEGNPDDIYGLAIGGGIAYGRFIFDMAYQYRFGDGVGGSGMEFLGLSQNMSEHTLYSSLIVHF